MLFKIDSKSTKIRSWKLKFDFGGQKLAKMSILEAKKTILEAKKAVLEAKRPILEAVSTYMLILRIVRRSAQGL